MTETDKASNRQGALDARTVVLDLFAAYDVDQGRTLSLSTKDLLQVGEILKIAPTAVRTAITRLKQEGRLEAVSRGLYIYSRQADPWRQRIDGWRTSLARRQPWDGTWLMAVIKPASLSRTGWRATLRALELEGFGRTPSGLWIRPDNLEGLDQTRCRLLAYGAASALFTARIVELDEASLNAAAALWDIEGIAKDHHRLTREIEDSLRRIQGETSDAAAREALVLGRAGVRAIIRDPLLPASMADGEPLRLLADVMRRYESVGKAVWHRRFGIGNLIERTA